MKTGTEKLERLHDLLTRYAHCWSQNPSSRMLGWVDAYNAERKQYPGLWAQFCNQNGYALDHDAYDVLA